MKKRNKEIVALDTDLETEQKRHHATKLERQKFYDEKNAIQKLYDNLSGEVDNIEDVYGIIEENIEIVFSSY